MLHDSRVRWNIYGDSRQYLNTGSIDNFHAYIT